MPLAVCLYQLSLAMSKRKMSCERLEQRYLTSLHETYSHWKLDLLAHLKAGLRTENSLLLSCHFHKEIGSLRSTLENRHLQRVGISSLLLLVECRPGRFGS